MTKDEIRSMDCNVYMDRLEDALWQNEVSALGMNYGHTCIHYNKGETVDVILERIIKEEKPGISNFSNKEDALSLVQAAVINDIENVTDWMMKRKSEFANPSDYIQYVTNVNMGEAVGKGIMHDKNTDTYSYRESNTVRFVLERSFDNDCCPYGFYLKTAYPSMSKANTKEIERFTKKDIISKDIYEFEDNYEKAFYICNKMNGCIVSNKKDETGKSFLKIYYADNDRSYKAFIQEDKLKVCAKEHNEDIYRKCTKIPDKLKEVIKKAENVIGVQREFSQKTFFDNCKDAFKKAIENSTDKQPITKDNNLITRP